jgi:PiT family inorganic phosphate transporter
LAGIIWDLITWRYGIPSSSSHALIGGLVGAAIAYAAGTHNIIWSGLISKVVVPLFASPIVGVLLGYLIMKLLFGLLGSFSHRFVNRWFSKLQILSASFMAYEHGKNDAQKSMGIITLALISAGVLHKGADVPIWVVVACALAMAAGTSVGGRRIIKTMGVSMIKLEPIGGFAAETASALVIQAASSLGAPVSTTHVISSSIMGVGASKRRKAVHWGLARNIVWAWIITIPATMLMGALVTMAIKVVV